MAERSSLRFPWYEATRHHPDLESGFEGVVIAVPEAMRSAERIPVFGTVQLRAETLETLGVTDRHPLRAVVLGAAAHYSGESYVGSVLYGAPLFPVEESKVYTEYFAVTLQEALFLSSAKRVFVWASVGPLITKPLRVWLDD